VFRVSHFKEKKVELKKARTTASILHLIKSIIILNNNTNNNTIKEEIIVLLLL
jgi:hypothetical protein